MLNANVVFIMWLFLDKNAIDNDSDIDIKRFNKFTLIIAIKQIGQMVPVAQVHNFYSFIRSIFHSRSSGSLIAQVYDLTTNLHF